MVEKKPYITYIHGMARLLCLAALSAWLSVPDIHAQAEQDTIPPNPADSMRLHSEKTDTLMEVEIRPDSGLRIMDVLDATLKNNSMPRQKSLGDILEKVAPGLQDKMLHPFAIKSRKKERKHKRDMDLLRDFDRSMSPNDLLEEALRKEGLEHIITKREKRQ